MVSKNPAEIVFSVSDFVAVFNQTINHVYPSVVITGELANFKISKNRWVYFDLKDELASVRFFGTVYNLPGPLEEGMVLTIRGVPQLHPQFGFSITIQSIQLAGEGTIKKAAKLLEAKLAKEGLFDESRKRLLPHPPKTIGLITSSESAAYADFIKILNQRWGGIHIKVSDVQVQGESAPNQIVQAINYFNGHAEPPDVLVITRGGGSADDLQAFSTENVARAVAGSRIPTMVAIGHEIDSSLAELAADVRASTPSNAAELLVPDRQHELRVVGGYRSQFIQVIQQVFDQQKKDIEYLKDQLWRLASGAVQTAMQQIEAQRRLIEQVNPRRVLERGYVLVRKSDSIVRSATGLQTGDRVTLQFSDGTVQSTVDKNSVQ